MRVTFFGVSVITCVIFSIFSIAILAPTTARCTDEEPLAVLMSCKGEITVTTASGTAVPGSFGYKLQAGDVVTTGTGASAEILFKDGNWIAVGAGSSMQIKAPREAAPSTEPAREENFQVVQNFLKLKDSEGTSSIAGLRSGGKSTEIVLESPCQTKIRERAPRFSWKTADPELSLSLTVYDENGVFWKADVEQGADSLRYPPDAPALESGTTYSWTVETSDPLIFPPLRSQAAFFEILEQKEAGQLDQALNSLTARRNPGEATLYLCRASLYFDHNLFEDAIKETRMAIEHDPDNMSLHAILARLYAETGRNEAALNEYNLILERR